MKKIVSLLKKFWIGLVLIAIGIGGLWWMIASQPGDEIEIETVKVAKGNVSVALDIDGKTVIDRRDVSFELGGKVLGIGVEEGDEVYQWQTLGWMDAREAQKNLEKVLRDYSSNRNDFEEASQVTYPNSDITDTVKRILEKNQWDLEKAVLDVELKNIALRKSYLTSPIKGVVAAVNVKPGETVSATANSVVVTIVDENNFYFESFVEDVEALEIEKEMKVRVVLDALSDQEILGKVVFVSSLATIDENDISSYKVKIEFNDAEINLLDGMIGEAEIVSKEVEDVLMVPNTAVKRENGKSVVIVVKGEDQEKRQVELGFTNGKMVEVKSGLTLGEEVVDFKTE